ncbi:MAG TPA: DUF1614 domain-containing protein [Oryzihumus sp.]|nr:DUF1614 domain-containing protein [Oryzihumus sp.]
MTGGAGGVDGFGGRVPPAGRRPRVPGTAVLALVLGLAVAVVVVHATNVAFSVVGLSPAWAIAVLAGSLLGSAINVPVLSLLAEPEDSGPGRVVVVRGGMAWTLWLDRPRRITVAVNVGGAIIPSAVSVYLLVRTGLWWGGLFVVALVALVVHRFATPVRRVGIVVPMILPALTAAAAALAVADRADAPVLAYVGGTLGTLVGADLTNLAAVRRMPASRVSIGGGGTFDGVFVSGVLAVLLAALR